MQITVTEDLDVNDRVRIDFETGEGRRCQEEEAYDARAVTPFMAGEIGTYLDQIRVLYKRL